MLAVTEVNKKPGLSSAKLSGATFGCPEIIFEVDFEIILKKSLHCLECVLKSSLNGIFKYS